MCESVCVALGGRGESGGGGGGQAALTVPYLCVVIWAHMKIQCTVHTMIATRMILCMFFAGFCIQFVCIFCSSHVQISMLCTL